MRRGPGFTESRGGRITRIVLTWTVYKYIIAPVHANLRRVLKRRSYFVNNQADFKRLQLKLLSGWHAARLVAGLPHVD